MEKGKEECREKKGVREVKKGVVKVEEKRSEYETKEEERPESGFM